VTAATRPVLLYDAGCRLCRSLARAVVRLDRHRALAVRPLDAPDAEALLAPLPQHERLASWRLVLPDGSLVGRGSGLPVLLRQLPATRRLGGLAGAVPDRLLDAGYEALARRRGALGRLVPDGPGPTRG
jgi:predicted DCC family thiol-disulfide oxidoreductase YuxK